MSDYDDESSRPKGETYGSLWHNLDRAARDVGLEFNANGSRLTAEVVTMVAGLRVSAHVLKRGGIAWFVGDENVTEQPPKTEHVTSFIGAHREALSAFLSHFKEVAPEDSDYRRYVLGEVPSEPEADKPVAKTAPKKAAAKKSTVRKAA
jgi:hypothetical protein